MSNYPDDFSTAEFDAAYGKAPDYNTPEPDDVRAAVKAYELKAVEAFEAHMRGLFPDFRIDWQDNPKIYIGDGLMDIAYEYICECERERE